MRRSEQPRIPYLFGLGVVLVLILVTVLGGDGVMASPADDGDVEAYGRIDSFPAALVGEWIVDDIIYEADGNTEYKQEAGPFAMGKCVKIAYFPETTSFTIRKVETEADSDCDGGTPTPGETETPEVSATPSPESTPDPDGEMGMLGIVDSLPSPGLIGAWIINGVEYLTDGGTEFEQRNGPFVVGACVEVKLRTSSNPAVIDEIETETVEDCLAPPTSTPDATKTPEDGESEVYGRVDSFPAGFIGDWIVDGKTYTADTNTEFEQDYGPFIVGTCVNIHANANLSPPAIREIETEHDFRCGNDSTPPSTPESEMFGVIQSFPDGLIGTWNIGGMTFVADSNTEFEQEDAPFRIGVTVKVHFHVEENGANRAREIETQFETDDDDDDGDGEFEGAEGHAFGSIDLFPAGLIGEWTIGGVTYMATDRTRFEDEDGDFAVNAQVKIEYVAQGNGRFARKIETTSDDGDVSDEKHARLFGFVRVMPANGFVGAWTVDDSAFIADSTSRFEEEHGLFAIGAFVSVEYSLHENGRLIHELESHVPPGAGPDDSIGSIDDLGGKLHAAAMQQNVWTIGGLDYQVLPATNLNDAAAPLVVGSMVAVNSYDDGNGGRVATQIRSMLFSEQIFLPLMTQ